MNGMALVDTLGRPLRSLRVSVTDRCNLRCEYCMPEEEYRWLPKEHLLRFEELARLVGVFTGLGVHKVRLTGGEPLLRHDLHRLVAMLARNPALDDLALTTNGILLAEQAEELRDAGLHRITVSLDTLRAEVFEALWHASGRRTPAGHCLQALVEFGPVYLDGKFPKVEYPAKTADDHLRAS
jgi:cyclic pyranopterin phosphate synthase